MAVGLTGLDGTDNMVGVVRFGDPNFSAIRSVRFIKLGLLRRLDVLVDWDRERDTRIEIWV